MKTLAKRDHANQPLTPAIRGMLSRARSFLSIETRSQVRRNALRAAIANLVETERMRLAMTIAHRHDAQVMPCGSQTPEKYAPIGNQHAHG